MDLHLVLKDIVAKLNRRSFSSEASVSQGIVLPVLNALGWPVFDTSIVIPEFSMEGRRVDFALCHPPSKPVIFVEVKKVGLTEGADRQLFEYAFHLGVPLAVLTDGQTWSFYLPGEAGRYDQRRVYKVDLLERTLEDSTERLERYLAYQKTTNGDALRAAQSDYRNVARERDVKSTFPVAWRALLEDQDPVLIGLLAEKVEGICGYKPTPDSCSHFFGSLLTPTVPTGQPIHDPVRVSPVRVNSDGPPTTPRKQTPRPGGQFVFSFYGTKHSSNSARGVMKMVFEFLESKDPGFLERFASIKHGRKRRYLARTPDKLYPGRPDLEVYSYEVRGGWWLGTNYSRADIQKIINLAKEVANPTVAEQLNVDVTQGY